MGNSIIYTKGNSSLPSDGRETIVINADVIHVGINSGNQEIAKDKDSGLNYVRNQIVEKTIYKSQDQKRRRWLALALETGKRGWYPGAIRIANLSGVNVPVKADKSDSSKTLVITSNEPVVKILDVEYDKARDIWYKITFNAITGYVRDKYIKDIRYTDNF